MLLLYIYNKNIINFLDEKNANYFDSTYKLMSLYTLDENNKPIIITCFILLNIQIQSH